MTNKARIDCSVRGWVEQEIELADGVTAEELAEMLENGDAYTTVQEDGNVITMNTSTGEITVLGTIAHCNNELEYFDFALHSEWVDSDMQDFLGGKFSRVTSEEIMEAIADIAKTSEQAVLIWKNPTDDQRVEIWEDVTNNGYYGAREFYWGEAGINWFDPSLL